jgi:hypothetical protein
VSEDDANVFSLYTEQAKTIAVWKRDYRQDVTDLEIVELVGHVVEARAVVRQGNTEKPFGFEGLVVGYGKECTFMPDKSDFAVRYSIHTDDGMGYKVVAGMTWEILA